MKLSKREKRILAAAEKVHAAMQRWELENATFDSFHARQRDLADQQTEARHRRDAAGEAMNVAERELYIAASEQ